MQAFFAAGGQQAVDRHDRSLWSALQTASVGGKRLRPRLVLASHEALGGDQDTAAAQVSDAVEMLHTAFVVHDDVIDADLTRRGRPTVAAEFADWARGVEVGPDRAARYGLAAAILAGDLALVGAVTMVATCGAPPDVVGRLLHLFEQALQRSAAGELADVRVSMVTGVDLAETLDVAEWKTAAYSFQLPLQAGAVLAGADEDTIDLLGEIGRLTGIAFQLRDDLRGVFGDTAETGKDPLSDLREGKGTALVAYARATTLWTQIQPYVGRPDLDAQGMEHARRLFTACGARQAVEDLADRLCRESQVLLAQLPTGAACALDELLDIAPHGARGAA